LSALSKNEFVFQELSELTGVKPYVIRFWETEFLEISPKLNSKSEKIYSTDDVDVIFRIKKLLFEDKLTIAQAKIKIKDPSPLINLDAKNSVVSHLSIRDQIMMTLKVMDQFKQKYF
jgi:DNA-binding transcriptional MerR regulator